MFWKEKRMNKHIVILVLLASILLTACGSDTPEPTKPPDPPPPTDTTTPRTPTEDTTFQDVRAYLGEWSGEWRNITFGSSGAARATFVADEDGTAAFTIDLDGYVFGAFDPDPMTYAGSFNSDGAVFDIPEDPLFGDLTITVTTDGEVSIVGDLVPMEGIAQISATGTITAEEMHLDYIVTFSAGDPAIGEMNLTKNP
jgi:hypothetical protein